MSDRTIQILEVGTLWGGIGAVALVILGTVAGLIIG